MTDHTPGPWNCCQESVDPEWWIVTIKGGLIVANVNAHFCQEANARLITAAPDMLAALKELEEFLDDQADADDGRPNDAMRHLTEVRAAIAKATKGA